MQPSSYSFLPYPDLETERMRLRQLTHADGPDVFEMRSDPDVMRYIPRPIAVTVDDAVKVIDMINDAITAGKGVNWGMEMKDTGKLVGIIGYVHYTPEHCRAEVGYSLNRAFHRQGLMREALLRVIRFGFEAMELHTIEAIIDAENAASGGLLKDVGFTQEAFFREDFLYDGEFRNSIHFGLLHNDPLPA